MHTVKIHDKQFRVSISSSQIQERIAMLGREITEDQKGRKPLLVVVLNGAFMFASDLMKHISGECEIAFVRVSSYEGTQSTGHVKNLLGLTSKIEGRSVILVEDIVDTGDTAAYLLEELRKSNPSRLELASLLVKPAALRHNLDIRYKGFEVPNDFLVGYGLDYDGLGRNLTDIYTLI